MQVLEVGEKSDGVEMHDPLSEIRNVDEVFYDGKARYGPVAEIHKGQ